MDRVARAEMPDFEIIRQMIDDARRKAMISEYRTKLIDKELLRRKLEEIYAEAEENTEELL